MTPRTLTTIGLTAVLAAGTLTGGYFAGAALRDDPAPKAISPSLANPLPIIRPIASGDTAPEFTASGSLMAAATSRPIRWVQPVADLSTTPDPEMSGGSTTVGSSASTTASTSAAAGASTTAAPTTTTTASSATTTTTPAIGLYDPAGSPSDDGAEHYDDPCAPADGSTPSSGDCPEGRHSVILALESVEPLQMSIAANPPGYTPPDSLWTTCEEHAVGPGAIIGISSNNPIARGTMTWYDNADPTNRHESTFNDSADRQSQFEGVRHLPEFAYQVGWRLQHCLRIDGLIAGHTYVAIATGTDPYGSTATTTTYTFSAIDSRVHPPTIVSPYNGNLLVIGWHRSGTALKAVAVPVGPTDDPYGVCQRVRTEGLTPGGAHSAGIEAVFAGTRTAPESEVGAAGYLYNHDYNDVTSLRLEQLVEGTQYGVCVGRFSNFNRSFDGADMMDAEAFSVTTPNRGRARATIMRVEVNGATEISTFVTAAGHASMTCGPAASIPAVTANYTPGLPLCDLFGDAAPHSAFANGMDLHLDIRAGARQVSSALRLDVPLPGCDGPCGFRETQWFTVFFPSVRVGTGMCQDPCDPPSSVGSLGAMLVKVEFGDFAHGGASAWAISSARNVTTTGEIVGDAPRWDANQRPSITGGIDPSATIPIVTDRPTTARVDVRAVDGGEPCLRDSAPSTVEDATLGVSHSIVLHGLCAGRRYAIRVVVIAENATSASFGWGPGVESAWLPGILLVPGTTVRINAQVYLSSTHGDSATSWSLRVVHLSRDGSPNGQVDEVAGPHAPLGCGTSTTGTTSLHQAS